MNRTITAGKYTITASYDPTNEYADNLTIIERDAFRGGRLVGTDTSSRYETSIDAEWVETATTRELIELALFGQWTFGYPYVGITDGALLCKDCAINELTELAEYDADSIYSSGADITVTVLQELPPAGEYCSGCESYAISEPFCEVCESESKELMHSDDGYHAICRDCLAGKLMSREATRHIVTYPWNDNTNVVYSVPDGGYYTYQRSYQSA